MAKAKGIDDISKAVMKALENARAGLPQSRPAVMNVADNTTKTYPKKMVKDPIFRTPKVKINSGSNYTQFDKGTPEYKAAYKNFIANKKRLDKINKMPSSGKNKEYKQALEAEERLKDFGNTKNFDSSINDRKIVNKFKGR